MASKTKTRVLEALLATPAQWHSGDALAQTLGMTRESVWKAVTALRKEGHVIESRKSQGYHYVESTQLDAAVIAFYAQGAVDSIQVAETVTSTQDVAKSWLASQTAPRSAAIFADAQTNGYGRRGRDFYSPKQTGLYLSVVLPNPQGDLSQVGLLTTGVATAVVRALHQFFPEKQFGLKWVNDVFLAGKKVAGILCEAVLELESASSAAFVIGIGLNLATTQFPQDLQGVAGTISAAGIDRNRFAATLLNEVMTIATDFQSGAFLDEYRSESITIGKDITLALGKQRVFGRVTGIANDGGLIVATPEGSRTFDSGEVIKVE